MAYKEKKRGGRKSEYLENEKSFLDEIKTKFIVFEERKIIIWRKNNIVDPSFKAFSYKTYILNKIKKLDAKPLISPVSNQSAPSRLTSF